jgi:peptide/nickel transport system permease protein
MEQFAIYVGDVVTGDFGKSILTARPVTEDIARVFPRPWSSPPSPR